MKKIFYLILLLTLVISCDNEKLQENNTITFWHFWSEPYQQNVIKEIVSNFEKEYNCKVILTELSWNDGKTKLFAAFNSNTSPDVLELGSDWVAQFSSVGVLEELDNNDVNLGKFIEFSKKPSLFNNKIYALPWIVDTRVLFINKDLQNQALKNTNYPLTFDELLNNSIKINSIKDKYGFGANGPDRHRLYKKLVTLFWTYGGDILDENSRPIINSTNNIEALDMYVKLSREGIIETQRQLDALFTEGKIGYTISGGWLIEKIKNENPNLNYDVSLIPSAKLPGISFAGGEYLAVSSKSKNKDLAIKFIKYMTDGKNSIEFCKKIIEAGFPADSNYYRDKYYHQFPKRLKFAEQLNSSRMTPVHPKWLDIETIIEEAAVEALYGKKSPKEALDDAQSKLESLLLVK